MNVGDTVPDFESTDQHGNKVTLSELVADGPIVLFFYPKAMTSGCTAESCHFRDLKSELAQHDARPVGISHDSVDKQKQFDEKNRLGYTLLSDPDNEVAKIMGASRRLIKANKRVTFVIGRDRTLLEVIKSETNMDVHADQALEVLKSA